MLNEYIQEMILEMLKDGITPEEIIKAFKEFDCKDYLDFITADKK